MLQVPLVTREHREIRDLLVHRVPLDQLVPRALPELLECLGWMVAKELLVSLGNQVQLDHQVYQDTT